MTDCARGNLSDPGEQQIPLHHRLSNFHFRQKDIINIQLPSPAVNLVKIRQMWPGNKLTKKSIPKEPTPSNSLLNNNILQSKSVSSISDDPTSSFQERIAWLTARTTIPNYARKRHLRSGATAQTFILEGAIKCFRIPVRGRWVRTLLTTTMASSQ